MAQQQQQRQHKNRDEEPWNLYYWPAIPGRGEFVRLLFEEAQVPYVDVGRVEGWEKVRDFVYGARDGFPVAAPPVIQRGDVILAQSMNICLYLAEKYGLCPQGDQKYMANQLALTLADFVQEVHDTHHPLTVSLPYEQQRDTAISRAKYFCELRIPKFLKYFERVLEQNKESNGQWLVGPKLSYVDILCFHVITGLEYAYPKNVAKNRPSIPRLYAVKERVAARPNIAAYIASPRRKVFSRDGIFRNYEECDVV